MDFSYFNSAPQPYQLFALSQPEAQTEGHTFPFDTTYTTFETQEHIPPAFATFNNGFEYNPPALHTQPPPPQPPTRSSSQQFLSNTPVSPVQPLFDSNGLPVSEANYDDLPQPVSSSEERDNATPQQNKRKAQNRAAQRAFRERKERHLKDLETKLANLQQQSVNLDSENERLRKELAKVATENEILKATAGEPVDSLIGGDELFGPFGFKPKNYLAKSKSSSRGKDRETDLSAKWLRYSATHTIVLDDHSGEPLLNSGQTWDYIQAHDAFQKGLVDVGDVCERLKKMARCDGQGPVFRESDIRKAIGESAVAGGRDELI